MRFIVRILRGLIWALVALIVVTIISIFSLNDFRHAMDAAMQSVAECGGITAVGKCLFGASDKAFDGTIMVIMRPVFVGLIALLILAQMLIWFFNRLSGGPMTDVVLSNEKLDEIWFETRTRSVELEERLDNIEAALKAAIDASKQTPEPKSPANVVNIDHLKKA